MPAPIPVQPRRDPGAADMGSLVDLGVVEEQPEPEPPAPTIDPFQEPVYEPAPDDAA
ncbi:hypothetical protein [Streptomyces sp. SGAir0957]